MAATGGKLTWYLWQQYNFKCLFQRKTESLKILDLFKWPPEIMTVPLQYMAACATLKLQYTLNSALCQIHWIYTIHDCKCCSKVNTVSIKDWMAATKSVKWRNGVP